MDAGETFFVASVIVAMVLFAVTLFSVTWLTNARPRLR